MHDDKSINYDIGNIKVKEDSETHLGDKELYYLSNRWLENNKQQYLFNDSKTLHGSSTRIIKTIVQQKQSY